MITPPRAAGPSVAGPPCSGRTSARARAASTDRICCRSKAASCSRHLHRSGPPSTSAVASPSYSARSLGSVAHGRVSLPSRRSRSFRPGESNGCRATQHRVPANLHMRGDAPSRIRLCRELLAPSTKADRSRGTIPRSPRSPAHLGLPTGRGPVGRRKRASRHQVPASSSLPTFGVPPSSPLDRRSTTAAPRPCDRRSTSRSAGCRPLACRRRRDPRDRDRTRRPAGFPRRTSDTDRRQVLSS